MAQKSFKIVFYKSEMGELVKVMTLYRMAEQLSDLINDPPKEFFEMLGEYAPVHGWAEIEDTRAAVFVIFARHGMERTGTAEEAKHFRDWLESVKPSDFSSRQ